MIISNDFELRRFIPNVMSTVEGEGSLYEKIEPYMGARRSLAVRYFHRSRDAGKSPVDARGAAKCRIGLCRQRGIPYGSPFARPGTHS